MFHIPVTRVWPAKLTGNNGSGGEGGILITGPVVLVWQSSGWPMEVTLTVIEAG